MTGPHVSPAGGLRIAGFAAGFFAITSLTIALTRVGGGLALVWLGSAVAAAMLIGLPRAAWGRGMAAIMAASALATSLFGFGPHMAAPLALINAFEAWLMARLLLALRPGRDWLDTIAGLAALIAVAGIIGPALAAVPGGFVASHAAPGSWLAHSAQWWAAHGLGTLIGFPLVHLATGGRREQRTGGRRGARPIELAAHLALIAVTAVLAMGQALLPLLFLPYAPLLLAAFRCGRQGAAFGTLVIAAVALWSFHEPSSLVASLAIIPAERVLFLQLYLATILLLALPASVALRQHQMLLAELEERKAVERLVADHSDDALLNLDEEGRIRYASPAGARLSGEEELMGRGLALFFDPLDEPLVRAALEQAARAPGEMHALERPVLCGEEQLWLQAKIRAVSPEDLAGPPQGFAVTIRDVTARKRTELDAIRAAETDPLTGLPNRRALLRQLERALAHAAQRPFGLAILDLDHFKAINDRHGHVAGDAVLRGVAAAMQRLAGPGSYFARLGGEEFALVARRRDLAQAEHLCERLRRETAALVFQGQGGEDFSLTASIGLARIAARMTTAQALQAADTLLYAAKHTGRNRVMTEARAGREAAERRVA